MFSMGGEVSSINFDVQHKCYLRVYCTLKENINY